jgi:hypothetical protein
VSLDSQDALDDEKISGQDTLRLYTHFFETDGAWQTLINNFTLQVAMNGTTEPGVVGMGLSSRVLQGLYDEGLIAGRTYSLYIGSGMDRAGGVINGSNTYGGYDAGRFIEPVHTYQMKPVNKNPLTVRVQDIVLNDSTGLVRNVSLFDPGAFPDMKETPNSFEAQITTDQYPMSFPYQLTQNYISKLSAGPSGNPDGSLKLNKPFNGTMTIKLDDGFEVTIPSDVMYNNSGISPVADRSQNSTEPFYLSVAWLSQVYVMIDYDSYTFHLAQAIAENKYVMPTTFCPKSTPTPYNPPASSTMNRAQLVGICLGGVMGGLFIISIVIALFATWRRKRLTKKVKKELEKGKASKGMTQFQIDDSGSEESGSPRPERRGLGKVKFWGKK